MTATSEQAVGACLVCDAPTSGNPAICSTVCLAAASRIVSRQAAQIRTLRTQRRALGLQQELARRNGELTFALISWHNRDGDPHREVPDARIQRIPA